MGTCIHVCLHSQPTHKHTHTCPPNHPHKDTPGASIEKLELFPVILVGGAEFDTAVPFWALSVPIGNRPSPLESWLPTLELDAGRDVKTEGETIIRVE